MFIIKLTGKEHVMQRGDLQSSLARQPKLLDQVRNKIRALHYARTTEKSYCHWVRRFILFHNKRHPKDMGKAEVEAFLTHLAVVDNVAASTQNQALAAILFLYQKVMEMEIEWLDNVVRAKKPKRIPGVFWQDEISSVLSHLSGTAWLMAMQMYDGGLRVSE